MYDDLVYIAVGSNIDPKLHIPETIRSLATHPEITLVQSSSYYASAAIGRPDQPEYRNGILSIRTELDPMTLKFDVLRPIEKQHGRVRTEDRYAPRTIDLDIALYKNQTIRTEHIQIPDSAIPDYAFVTIPLLEIAPEIHVPGMDHPLASSVTDSLVVDTELTTRIQKGLSDGHSTR
jgi:2-amino-4-hydroxy-6-hydroxymethyldihydropteridine diphosphokinase